MIDNYLAHSRCAAKIDLPDCLIAWLPPMARGCQPAVLGHIYIGIYYRYEVHRSPGFGRIEFESTPSETNEAGKNRTSGTFLSAGLDAPVSPVVDAGGGGCPAGAETGNGKFSVDGTSFVNIFARKPASQ
jgi:hypothetical protein